MAARAAVDMEVPTPDKIKKVFLKIMFPFVYLSQKETIYLPSLSAMTVWKKLKMNSELPVTITRIWLEMGWGLNMSPTNVPIT